MIYGSPTVADLDGDGRYVNIPVHEGKRLLKRYFCLGMKLWSAQHWVCCIC